MSIRLRPAVESDVALYARLFPALETGDPVPTPERILARLPSMQVVERDGEALGFVHAESEGEVAFLRQIVVDAAAQRTGLGRELMAGACARLRDGGARRVRLNVKADNAPAIALYRSCGLGVDFESVALWAPRGMGRGLPGSTRPLAVYAPAPVEDAALEARFRVPRGQLAHFRAHGQLLRAVRWAGAPGELLGLMRLDPSFPGAYPFCATTPAVARALLGEIDAQVPVAQPRVSLVVERDEKLVEHLRQAGAQLRFRMLQMEGTL